MHSRRTRCSIMRSCLYVLIFSITSANALHFYLDSDETKCFIEELPSETAVEGHYKALEFDRATSTYLINDKLGIDVEVDEVESGHSVTKTRGPPEGKFTFTSHEAGDHTICITTNYSSSMFSASTHIKFYLDMTVGSTRPNIEKDRSHVSGIVLKLRDLNSKMDEVQREQQYQREREASFRDLSEATNFRAVLYTLIQIVVLLATCFWQLRHLRSFFRDSAR